jgi:hypothetical protein
MRAIMVLAAMLEATARRSAALLVSVLAVAADSAKGVWEVRRGTCCNFSDVPLFMRH